MHENGVSLEQLLPLIQERLRNGQSVRFTPRGSSMRPMLEGGRDQVILSPLPKRLKKYDLPLYRRENGQLVLHRVVKAGQGYTCIGDNQFYRETDLHHGQMLAVVTGFVRKGKTYSVSHPGYWLYCRFWYYSRPVRHLWLRGTGFLRRVAGCRKKSK